MTELIEFLFLTLVFFGLIALVIISEKKRKQVLERQREEIFKFVKDIMERLEKKESK